MKILMPWCIITHVLREARPGINCFKYSFPDSSDTNHGSVPVEYYLYTAKNAEPAAQQDVVHTCQQYWTVLLRLNRVNQGNNINGLLTEREVCTVKYQTEFF